MYVRRWWDTTASIFLIHSPSCSLVRTSTKKCAEGAIDLLVCKADYRVDVNEKARQQIGIAKYKEYVKEMEEKHGKEKAAALFSEPREKQQMVRDYRLLWRVMNGKHPKGGPPKTEREMAEWSRTDQVRLEMGEEAWKSNAEVVIAEFGKDKATQLLGLANEDSMVRNAFKRFGMANPIPVTEDDHAAVKEIEEKLKTSKTNLKWDGTDTQADVAAAMRAVGV